MDEFENTIKGNIIKPINSEVQLLTFKDNPSAQPSGGPDNETKLYVLEQLSNFKDSITSNFIGIFGLFAALVAFLGFGIQILGQVANANQAIGMLLILIGGVLVIVFVAHFFKESLNFVRMLIMFVLIVSVFMVGAYLLIPKKDGSKLVPHAEVELNNSLNINSKQ